jgi:hypothetical protein
LFAVQIGGCSNDCPYDDLVDKIKTAKDTAASEAAKAKTAFAGIKTAATCEDAKTFGTQARTSATLARTSATEAQLAQDNLNTLD